MVSNKHFDIDLISLEAPEVSAPSFDEIIYIANLENSENPFGNTLTRGKFIKETGNKWLIDEGLSEFNYQKHGYDNQVSQFELIIKFDSPIEIHEINSDKFLYSLSKNIITSKWRNGIRHSGAYVKFGKVEEGSIYARLIAGVLAFGTFVVNYPDLKEGFREIITDAEFISEKITTAIRASKIPDDNQQKDEEKPIEKFILDRRQRLNPENLRRILNDD